MKVETYRESMDADELRAWARAAQLELDKYRMLVPHLLHIYSGMLTLWPAGDDGRLQKLVDIQQHNSAVHELRRMQEK